MKMLIRSQFTGNGKGVSQDKEPNYEGLLIMFFLTSSVGVGTFQERHIHRLLWKFKILCEGHLLSVCKDSIPRAQGSWDTAPGLRRNCSEDVGL